MKPIVYRVLCDIVRINVLILNSFFSFLRVHVRRTDKLPEAVYHKIEEYMPHVSHSLKSSYVVQIAIMVVCTLFVRLKTGISGMN